MYLNKVEIAQRLREYVNSPHHVDPLSEGFRELIEMAAKSLVSVSDYELDLIYWDFDARRKGYSPYNVPYGSECSAFKTAFNARLGCDKE